MVAFSKSIARELKSIKEDQVLQVILHPQIERKL